MKPSARRQVMERGPHASTQDGQRRVWTRCLAPAVAAVGLTACGDAPAAPYELTFAAADARLLVVQDGDGAWQQLRPGADGVARFTVTSGRYGYGCACPAMPGGAPTTMRMVFETEAPDQPIYTCGAGPRVLATVSGHVTATGDTLVFGDNWVSTPQADGSYVLPVPIGRADIAAVATAATSRIVVRRDVDVTGDLTLDLDIDADGVALVPATATVTGAGADPITYTSELHTANGTYVLLHGGAEPRLVPAAQVAAADTVTVAVTATRGAASRTVQHVVPASGAGMSFAVPPSSAPAVARSGGAWDRGFAWNSLILRAPVGAPSRALSVGATDAWLAGATIPAVPVIDPTTLPGWDPTWTFFAPGAALSWELGGWTGDYDGELETAYDRGTLTW